jgi:hypothetical protein
MAGITSKQRGGRNSAEEWWQGLGQYGGPNLAVKTSVATGNRVAGMVDRRTARQWMISVACCVVRTEKGEARRVDRDKRLEVVC